MALEVSIILLGLGKTEEPRDKEGDATVDFLRVDVLEILRVDLLLEESARTWRCHHVLFCDRTNLLRGGIVAPRLLVAAALDCRERKEPSMMEIARGTRRRSESTINECFEVSQSEVAGRSCAMLCSLPFSMRSVGLAC